MDSFYVYIQIVPSSKLLVAVRAREFRRSLCCITVVHTFLVFKHVGLDREHFATIVALIRFFGKVHRAYMSDQIEFAADPYATKLAFREFREFRFLRFFTVVLVFHVFI